MKRVAVGLLVLALGLAACGGDDDAAESSPPTQAVSKTADVADTAHAAEHAAGEHDMADMAPVDDRGFALLENGEPVENPVGFAGPNDTWHVHHNLCLVANPNGGMDTPLGADQDVEQAECDAINGTLLEQTQYLLHVWVVPGYESPEGVFSHLSSTMACDDGTFSMKSYDMTEGVADIGTSSTVCKDGTE
jgi:hypothetical protein